MCVCVRVCVCRQRGFDIQWIDESHALALFSHPVTGECDSHVTVIISHVTHMLLSSLEPCRDELHVCVFCCVYLSVCVCVFSCVYERERETETETERGREKGRADAGADPI